MQPVLQYFHLRNHFRHVGENESFPVTIDELADVLCCTPRNVKFVIRKLEALQWIGWQPGRGRGNASSIAFAEPKEPLLLEAAKSFAVKGDMKTALEYIHEYGDGTSVKERFMEWLNGYFGYVTETLDEQEVETLRFPVFRTVGTMDPARVFYAFDAHLVSQLFDCLVRYDHDTKTIVPNIAHHWESNEDATEWTFYLRKGVRFHHGRELEAEDVVFTLQRLGDVGQSIQVWVIPHIGHAEVLNRRTVRVKLNSPNHLFLRYLCTTPCAIVPKDIVLQRGGTFDHDPVGAGPFRVAKKTDTLIVLEAFPQYFKERAHLDRVEIIIVSEKEADILQLPTLEHLLCSHGDAGEPRLEGWEQEDWLVPGCSLLTFNMAKPGPQQHLKFREALHRIVDRKGMIREIGDNRVYPAHSFMPPARIQTLEPTDDYDPQTAKRLLAEMGYDGQPLRLFTSHRHAKDAYWIQKQCEANGIVCEVYIAPKEEVQRKSFIDNADCILYEAVLNDDEVDRIGMFQQAGDFIYSHMGDHLAGIRDRLVAGVVSEPNPEERARKLAEMEGLLREHRYILFLLHKKTNITYHPSVRGLRFNQLGWVDFKPIWFVPQG